MMPAAVRTQKSVARPASKRTRRRSRPRIFWVNCRGSGAAGDGAMSRLRRARPSSFSVMEVHPFEDTAQSALGIVQAGAYRAHLTAHDRRDLFISHVFDVPEHQHFPV